MRDQSRIYPFCTELAALWAKHPDMRFGQVMSNIARYVEVKHKKDIFYLEDEELLKIIKEYYGVVST